jgi:hypothetical protein
MMVGIAVLEVLGTLAKSVAFHLFLATDLARVPRTSNTAIPTIMRQKEMKGYRFS